MRHVRRHSDQGVVVVQSSAEKVKVTTQVDGTTVDTYLLTPEECDWLISKLEIANIVAKQHRARRKQEESSGLTQTSFS